MMIQTPIKVIQPRQGVNPERAIRTLCSLQRNLTSLPSRWLIDLRQSTLVHVEHGDLAELGKVISMLIDGFTMAKYFVGVVAVDRVDLGLANVVRVFAEPSIGQLEVLLSTDFDEVESWLDGV